MTALAVALFVVYLLVGFGLRTWLQWRRTGDTGFRGVSGRLGSSRWWAGVLFVLALVAGLLGPVAAMAGLPVVPLLEVAVIQWTGVALTVAGIVGTFRTQLNMGASWRIGVDDGERTALVTSGAFRLVRNPIFTAMAITGLGLALMVPNAVALSGFVLLVIAFELQVRVVEEPYLVAAHGDSYVGYASRTGRFVPGVGRLRNSHGTSDAVRRDGSRSWHH